MAWRRWGEWASARMLRALVREGARVHAAAGVHGLWHHLCSSLRVAGRGCPKSAFAGGVPAFFGPIPRVTGASVLGQEPKADIFRGRTLTKRQQSPGPIRRRRSALERSARRTRDTAFISLTLHQHLHLPSAITHQSQCTQWSDSPVSHSSL